MNEIIRPSIHLVNADGDNAIYIYADKIKSISIDNRVAPIPIDIPIGSISVLIEDEDFDIKKFQKKTIIYLKEREEKEEKAYIIIDIKQVSKNKYSIKAENVVRVLEETKMNGDVYSYYRLLDLELSVTPKYIFQEIAKALGISNVDSIFNGNSFFRVDEVYKTDTTSIYGHIFFGTSCREVLQSLCMAIGATVYVSGENIVVEPFEKRYPIFSSNANFKEITLANIYKNSIEIKQPPSLVVVEHDIYEIDAANENATETVIDFSKYNVSEKTMVVFEKPTWISKSQLYNIETYVNIHELTATYIMFTILKKTNIKLIGIDFAVFKKIYKNSNQYGGNKKETVRVAFRNSVSSEEGLSKAFELALLNAISNETVSAKIVEKMKIIGGNYIKYGSITYGTQVYGSKTKKIKSFDIDINAGDMVCITTDWGVEKCGIITNETHNAMRGSITKNIEMRVYDGI